MNHKSVILKNLTWFTDRKLSFLPDSQIESKGKHPPSPPPQINPKQTNKKNQFTARALLEPINGSPELIEIFIKMQQHLEPSYLKVDTRAYKLHLKGA